MKAYITCPVSHSQNRLNLLPVIEQVAKESGLDTFVFEIGGDSKDIFRRDYEQLKSCDILIAEVSERSHEVGIEIGLSYCLGLRRILLIESGQSVTKLAQGIPDTTIVEYEDVGQLKARLKKVLN